MSNSISLVEGQQNEDGDSSPLRLLLLGWMCRFISPVYLLSCPEAAVHHHQLRHEVIAQERKIKTLFGSGNI